MCCFSTYTSNAAHEIVRANLHLSATTHEGTEGKIPAPRYCPSLETKIQRFAERERHLVWLEPEGWESDVIYPNGLSNSLPADTQLQLLRSIAGLENVEMLRPGTGVRDTDPHGTEQE